MLKKLKDKLNKPYAATWEEWDIWNKNSKEKYPFEYFLLETIPDKWNNFTKFFTHPINDFRFYVRSRFFDKYHLVNTGLKPGGYYEVDTRLIHSAFNLLVDYIEVECAHMNSLSNKEKKKSKPWWSKGLTRFKSFRDRQSGLDYLDWEMTLDDPKLNEYERSDRQAQAAREKLELYIWWTQKRPARIDSMDLSGWSDYCDTKRVDELFSTPKDELEQDYVDKILDKTSEIENKYEVEDEEMLIRLIKIRKTLWT